MIVKSELIEQERKRQHEKFGKEPLANADSCCRILGEEYGEICRCVNQGNFNELEHEIIQLIAVALAWLENNLHDGRQP